MKSYDKATWHIDGGEEVSEVIMRFKSIFEFLSNKEMLTEDGIETFEYGMDSSVSLNSTMVTSEGEAFLDSYYDDIIKLNPDELKKNLQSAYDSFINDNR